MYFQRMFWIHAKNKWEKNSVKVLFWRDGEKGKMRRKQRDNGQKIVIYKVDFRKVNRQNRCTATHSLLTYS